jgi:hypothetical protein
MTLTTPAGRIQAQSSPNLSVVSGVVGGGLTTTVLPARRAGACIVDPKKASIPHLLA